MTQLRDWDAVSDPRFHPDARRPRRWPIVLPLALVVALAAGWSGIWYYAASRAQSGFAAWQVREAARGRAVTCTTQDFSGFPFRFELSCTDPALSERNGRLTLKAKSLHAAMQVYQPNLAIAEFAGPLAVTQDGRAAGTLDWALAQASVHGLSLPPERVSVVLDRPAAHLPDGTPLADAAHGELHVRPAAHAPQDPPAFDVALTLAQAHLAGIARLRDLPIDADITATLRGLADFSPRPWRQVLRDLQAANGRLELSKARIREGDILAVGQGTLTLTPRGMLDGEIDLTVAGIEQLMATLGLDEAVGRASQKALDRLAPGLNLNALFGPRGNAAIAAAGAAMLGKPAELEGRQAVTLPLRLADGTIFLGPLKVGEMTPLF
jgi:hypothetical protein